MAAASSSEPPIGALAYAVDDDGTDDSKFDKKRKFKPFKKMKNFFRGGSKKARFKPEEIGQKSHSIGALHHKSGQGDDDDDDGGFRSQVVGLAGSRSISEDSVFKPELKDNAPIGVLQGQTVSMENIDTNLHIQSLSTARTSGQSSNQESDQSLRSMSDEDLIPSKMRTSSDSIDGQMDDTEFDLVNVTSTSLSNDAAKHRISVKPKSRRLSAKMSMKRRDRSPAGQLADVQEESGTSHQQSESKSSASHKTVISTTIPVGSPDDSNINVIPVSDAKPRNPFSSTISAGSYTSQDVERPAPKDLSRSYHESWEPERSQARDIPSRAQRPASEIRPRSLSPLSTSPPISTSMLQDVKLRSRPSIGKASDKSDAKVKEVKQPNELAKAFDRAKRISRKFDETGSGSSSTEAAAEKSKPDIKPAGAAENVVKDVKPQSEILKPSETHGKPDSNVASEKNVITSLQTSSAPASGVSFVLKKEPMRPAGKTSVTTVTSFGGHVETSSIVSIDEPVSTSKSHSSDSKTDSEQTVSAETSVSNKLASPREEYRIKRQARSKTLPVSKDTVDKAEEKIQSFTSSVRRTDYDNVTVNQRGGVNVAEKRSSWAPASLSGGGTADTRPEWVIRAQKLDKKIEEDKENKPREVKVDVGGSKGSGDIEHGIDMSRDEKGMESTPKPSTQTTTPIKQEKVALTATKPGYSVNAARSPFVKPTPASTVTKPTSSDSSSKPVVNNTTPSKPAVGSISKLSNSFNKSSEDASKAASPASGLGLKKSVGSGNTSSSTVNTEKPPIQSVKPSVSSGANKPAVLGDKPPVQSVKSTAATSSATTRFTGVPKTSENSVNTATPRPVIQKQSSGESNKPATPFSIKSAAVNNNKSNVLKSDTKDPSPKIQQTSSVNKNITIGSDSSSKTQTSSVNKNIAPSKQVNNNSGNLSTSNRQGSMYGKTDVTSKSTSNNKREMKIEIIDKDQKPANVVMREPKTTPEKCSDVTSNRPSKVLDMVKSFQKLQVT